jgi:hypothetical protein
MRRFINLVEDDQWRSAVLSAAMEPESMITALQPAETGLGRTVYASETPDIPAVIIDARMGAHFAPDDRAVVLAFGERSGDPLVDRWLTDNEDALRAYHVQKYDTPEFYAVMRPVTHIEETTLRSVGVCP